MAFEPTKVVKMDKGKQVGDTLMQDASTIPYGNSNVSAALTQINQDLANCHINILLNSSYTTDDLVTSIVRTTGQQYYKDGKTLIVSVNIVISGLTGTQRAVCELYCENITSNTKIIQGSIFYDGYVYSVKGTTQDDWSTVSVSFYNRIDALDSNKQNKTDNSLETNNKTVVGAINEINSNLTVISTAVSVSYHPARMALVKYGKVVFASLLGDWSQLPSGYTKVGSLPTDYYPSNKVTMGDSPYNAPYVRIEINTNGDIETYNYGNTMTGNQNGNYSSCWITN